MCVWFINQTVIIIDTCCLTDKLVPAQSKVPQRNQSAKFLRDGPCATSAVERIGLQLKVARRSSSPEPVRNVFEVESAPESDKRRITTLQKKRHRTSSACKGYLKARKVEVVYIVGGACSRRKALDEILRRQLALTCTAASQAQGAGTAVHLRATGKSEVDRVQSMGAYQKDKVVACCKTRNFGKEPLPVDELLGTVEHILRSQRVSVKQVREYP